MWLNTSRMKLWAAEQWAAHSFSRWEAIGARRQAMPRMRGFMGSAPKSLALFSALLAEALVLAAHIAETVPTPRQDLA